MSINTDFEAQERRTRFIIALVAAAIPIAIIAMMAFLPPYRVWLAEQDGKATLARAESTRQAQVIDAQAKLQAAQYLSQAADEIQTKLTPEYLEFLRIQMLGEVGEHNPNAIYFEAHPLVATPAAGAGRPGQEP